MEGVGFGVSIVSLASLFETALHCFEYIQLAKSFGSDFQTSCLKLDNAQLRLTRWGVALGLGSRADNVKSLDQTSLSDADIKHAEQTLGHIINLFQQAQETSSAYETGDVTGDLTGDALALHQRVREICVRRQREANIKKKTKWALHEKERFSRLINDLRDLTDDLVQTFPPVNSVQHKMCDQEATDLQHHVNLTLLKEIAAQQDPPLKEAIGRLESTNAPVTHNTWNNSDNTKVLNQAGTQTFHGGQTFTL